VLPLSKLVAFLRFHQDPLREIDSLVQLRNLLTESIDLCEKLRILRMVVSAPYPVGECPAHRTHREQEERAPTE
jgi:hypothetical protein